MNKQELSTEQLSRYSRHLLLPEIDLEGQARLRSASALLIGAGGLGSPAAMYLTSSGVGEITIFDHDNVDLGNLQRQIAYDVEDIGHPKAIQLKKRLQRINPDTQIKAIHQKADKHALLKAMHNVDVTIDACDNFDTRFIINEASLDTSTPLICGAATRFAGQVTVFDPRSGNSPCYRCLYSENEDAHHETCRDRGVFAPLVGIIGSIQAAETIKILLHIGKPLTGKLLQLDAKTMIPRLTTLPKDPNCPACGN